MSVLFIGKRFYTNRDALREKYGRIWQLPWHWAQAGVATRLWLVDYHTRETVQEKHDALDVFSTPVRNLALFRHWLSGAYAVDGKADTIIASGDCYIAWMGLRIARKLKARFVFDVYDKYDEFAGYHSPPGFDMFSYLLGRADVRLFASRALMDDLRRSALDRVVPNGVDTRRFQPRNLLSSRHVMGLPDSGVLIGYFGGMEPDRGVADLIEAVALLRGQGMDLGLVLGGRQVPGLDLQKPWIAYLGDVPYERMPDALSACDLLAVPYRRSPFMDAGSSNKIAEAMACKRPVVATRTPNLLANFPAQSKALGPVLAEPGDPGSLARSIRLQLRKQLLVSLPGGMSWHDIAQTLAHHLALSRNILEAEHH